MVEMQMDPSTSAGDPHAARQKRPLVKIAKEGIGHVEAAYQEIDERIELHLEHFDKLLEKMRENYRAQLMQAKNDARDYVERAIERWSDTSDEIVECHEALEQSKQAIGMFSSSVSTGRYSLDDDERDI